MVVIVGLCVAGAGVGAVATLSKTRVWFVVRFVLTMGGGGAGGGPEGLTTMAKATAPSRRIKVVARQ